MLEYVAGNEVSTKGGRSVTVTAVSLGSVFTNPIAIGLINPKTTNEGCAMYFYDMYFFARSSGEGHQCLSFWYSLAVDHLSKIQERQPSRHA